MSSFDGFEFNELEARLKMTLDSLSNGGAVDINEEWIAAMEEDFRASIDRQFNREQRTFRLRASNAGRPLCQLQLEARGTNSPKSEYNHILRMLIGDATEAVVTLIIKASGANITGHKNRVSFKVGETTIEGENDIEIDGKVYDIKSASSYSFNHKWNDGWDGLFKYDTFGYVEQLYIYAEGNPDRMGGWIVFDKSSGEIKVVEAHPTKEQLKEIQDRLENTEKAIREEEPFKKLYTEEEETYYRKATGNTIVPMTCTFCPFIQSCWPDAVYLANPSSSARNPAKKWYASKPTFKSDGDK